MKTNTQIETGQPASPITAFRAATGLAHYASVILVAIFAIMFTFATGRANGQASITSPSTNEVLPLPTFSLFWNNAGQVENFIYLGSSQGQNDYYGASMGKNSNVSFTWPGAPASVWVRLWSRMWAPVYSGTSQSTVAYWAWQWVPRDYFYRLGQASAQSASDRLIDSWLQRFQSDNGKNNGTIDGMCKRYLQLSFVSVATQMGIRTPSGAVPSIPPNETGYYWKQDWNSGFTQVLQVLPSAINKLEAVKTMLRQVKKGDCVQYGTQVTVDEGLHTLAITADYDAASGIIRWADCNWTVAYTVNADQSRSLNDLASIIANSVKLSKPAGTYPKGATLYRVRRDLK